MTPTLVDTQFVVALVNIRDQWHSQALEIARHYEGQPLLITQPVLLEIGNALARSFKSEAVKTIQHFLNAPEVEVVPLTSARFEEAFELYSSRSDKDWGLVDCVSFIVMRERGITTALTNDQHFVQAGFTALLR